MKTSRPVLVSFAFASLAACGAPQAELPEVATHHAALVGPHCPGERWVGLRSGPICEGAEPVVGTPCGWVESELFALNNPAEPVRSTVDPALFCEYEWTCPPWATTPPPTGGPVVFEGGTPMSLEPDCFVVSALSGDYSSDVWEPMRDAFFAQVDRVDSLPGSPGSVRVAVVDSSPKDSSAGGSAVRGQFEHALAIGRVVRELSCPEERAGTGNCVGYVSSHLGLPQEDPTTLELVEGGFYGSWSQVAQAIEEATDSWLASSHSNLIINLSLGWEASFGGTYSGSPSTMAVGPLEVFTQLERAACHGALIIAAAGNDPGGVMPHTGPMFPAAWETSPLPSGCGTGAGYEALVYAVGGVDGRDRPLHNARLGARPRLVAPAEQVVVESDPSAMTPSPVDIYTGTSMAAAVASGVAAMVWGYDSSASAADVMATLHQSAVDLSTSGGPVFADFCAGGSCADPVLHSVRRVSACTALLAVCPSCASSVSCATPPAYGGTTVSFSAPAEAALNAASALVLPHSGSLSVNTPASPLAICGPSQTVTVTGSPSVPGASECPDENYRGYASGPSIGPQPGVVGCDVCALALDTTSVASSTLYLGIASELTTYVSLPVLDITYNSGVTKHFALYDLDPSLKLLAPGDTVKLSNFNPQSANIAKVQLVLSVFSPYTSTSPADLKYKITDVVTVY